MYILFLIIAALILGLIIRVAWPLIIAFVVIVLVCYLLSLLKQRQDKKKKEANIIDGEYREREEEA